MSHQPFENWILTDEPLEPDQQQALETHLEGCEDCNTISNAWMEISETIAISQTPEPAPGFTQRWHNRLALRENQRQQQKMWMLTLGLFFLAGVISLVLIIYNQTTKNMFYEMSQVIANFSLFAVRINKIWTVSTAFIKNFPIILPIFITCGVGMLAALGALFITWLGSMYKLFSPVQEGVTIK